MLKNSLDSRTSGSRSALIDPLDSEKWLVNPEPWIFGIVTERAFQKKSKAQKHIQIDAKLRSVMIPRFGIFSQDSRIRVHTVNSNSGSQFWNFPTINQPYPPSGGLSYTMLGLWALKDFFWNFHFAINIFRMEMQSIISKFSPVSKMPCFNSVFLKIKDKISSF